MGIYDAEIGRRRRKFWVFIVENGDFLIENSMIPHQNQSKSRLQRAEGISRTSEHIVITKFIKYWKSAAEGGENFWYGYI